MRRQIIVPVKVVLFTLPRPESKPASRRSRTPILRRAVLTIEITEGQDTGGTVMGTYSNGEWTPKLLTIHG